MRPIVKIEGLDKVKKALKEVPKQLFTAALGQFKDTSKKLVQAMVKRTSNQNLHVGTGALRRGFLPKVGGTNLKTLFLEVANRIKYVAIHEFGGIIRPVRKKFLTIPTDNNKTKAGVARKSAAQAREEGKTFIFKGKRGGLVIMENRGKNRKPVPLFILVKQVKIPKRLGFRVTTQYYANLLYKKLRGLITQGNY